MLDTEQTVVREADSNIVAIVSIRASAQCLKTSC
jgi:hypothetical protein